MKYLFVKFVGKRYEEEELLKEEPVSPRHMKRYISQLIHAKEVCEKRLAELGFYTYSKDTSTSLASSASSTHHGLTFEAVMSYAFSRLVLKVFQSTHFYKFTYSLHLQQYQVSP